MKSEILVIAEAVLANIRVLEMLINKLPDADRAAVAEKVQSANPTPVAVPVATPAPAATVVTTVPAAASPVTVPVAPAPAPVPVATVNPNAIPFTNQKELITYVMAKYKSLGPNGNKIQEVLNAVGVKNINDVQPAMYKALFDGIEALS